LQSLGTFAGPVFVTSPPADQERLFVVEQAGRVRILKNDTPLTTPFLDLRTKIGAGGERGLLSIAFHPQYASNGRFYVYFTNLNGDIRIVRYLVSGNADVANEASADTVIDIPHPVNANHNGGQLQFGPDGALCATGDGGGGGSRRTRRTSPHARQLLRLDVDVAAMASRPTIRSAQRCGRTDCAIRGVSPLTAKRAISTSATSGRISGKRWMWLSRAPASAKA
jgi:glucose/arabinose dehydrogenase